jgi:hypothetical protein
LKFLTTNYIPVKTLTSDDSSAQWDVQQAASNGTIEAVLLTAGGSAYLESNGTIQLVNSTAITLESKASGTDNIYNGSTLYIRSGLGSGQLKEIVDYNSSTYDLTTKLTLTGVSGTFQLDEMIDGGTSGASARILQFANTNATSNAGILSVSSVYTSFTNTEVITANTSGITATIAGIDARDLQNHSGEILYIENRPPVTRATDQIEDIKLIIRY